MNRKRDQLIDEALLSSEEIESWKVDVRALREGKIKDVVIGSDFWELAKTEMVRRQAYAQIRAARAMVFWTLILAFFTGLLVAVSVAQLWMR